MPDNNDMTNSGCRPGDVCMFVKCVRNVCVRACDGTKAQSVIPGSHNSQRLIKIKNMSFYSTLLHLICIQI